MLGNVRIRAPTQYFIATQLVTASLRMLLPLKQFDGVCFTNFTVMPGTKTSLAFHTGTTQPAILVGTIPLVCCISTRFRNTLTHYTVNHVIYSYFQNISSNTIYQSKSSRSNTFSTLHVCHILFIIFHFSYHIFC